MSIDQATKHLARARRQWDRAANSIQAPQDPEAAVTWAFYAYENCVTALAELYGRTWTKSHWDKARLARGLHEEELISRDVGGTLDALNALRKDVAYGEPGPSLQAISLADLASGLESLVEEVESRIGALGGGGDGH